MKSLIKKLIPKQALGWYHRAVGELAAVLYGHPSEKLVVIGVTGTKGKSSTVMLIGRFLQEAGEKVGWTSTATFRVGEREWLNDTKMTMLGRFALQRLLAQMVAAGCTYAIVETSSEGISQFRHRAINYDMVLLTNLTPEHIEAHGGFENYKQAKLELFKHLTRRPGKTIRGKKIDKVAVVNADSKQADEFLKISADVTRPYSLNEVSDIETLADDTRFSYGGIKFSTRLLGTFNIYNIIAAITAVQEYGVSPSSCEKALTHIDALPGRMEFIQRQPFAVIVDYAHEPASTQQLYETVKLLEPKRIIQVFGSTGGGRDIGRRAKLGELAARFCDMVIITTDDPYDDDPAEIARAVVEGAEREGGKKIIIELDRQKAIELAVRSAQQGDVVLITGKGSEQAMVVRGRKLPWDDREVARSALKV